MTDRNICNKNIKFYKLRYVFAGFVGTAAIAGILSFIAPAEAEFFKYLTSILAGALVGRQIM